MPMSSRQLRAPKPPGKARSLRKGRALCFLLRPRGALGSHFRSSLNYVEFWEVKPEAEGSCEEHSAGGGAPVRVHSHIPPPGRGGRQLWLGRSKSKPRTVAT